MAKLLGKVWLTLRSEFQFNNFVGFMGSRLPLPLSQRILSRLDKQGMAPLYFEGLHLPVRGHQHICPYVALDSQGACEARILWHRFGNNFAAGLGGFLGGG